MKRLEENWEFDVLGVYNYKQEGPLTPYFDFVAENHEQIEGDIYEAGVFRGRSLLGLAMMLKELGSKKKVFGFDTFSGFPPVLHEKDNFARWEDLYSSGKISKEHYEKVRKNHEYRMLGGQKKEVNPLNISLSGDFSGNSLDLLQSKVDFLGLDNVELVAGPFSETFNPAKKYGSDKVMAVLIDADLYDSYHSVFNFAWPKLSTGGMIYLDEYYSLKFPGARIATDEFFANLKDKPVKARQRARDFERWYVRKILSR
jgi:hypothetical protein